MKKKTATKRQSKKQNLGPLSTEMVELSVDLVSPVYDADTNPNQMTGEDFELLKTSIKRNGFLEPILVRKELSGFKVINGHHRFRAAQELGLPNVLAVITDAAEPVASALGVGMNRLRGDLNLSRVVDILKEVRDETGWSAEQLSSMAGFSAEEITSLIEEQPIDVELENVLGSGVADDGGAPAVNPYVLEIEFPDREQYKLARRKLRRAAGKGNDIYVGLLSVLGEEHGD